MHPNIRTLTAEMESIHNRALLAGRDLTPEELDAIEARYERIRVLRGVGTTPIRSREHGPFRTLGEQLACIIEAGRPGGKVDERLHKVNAAASGASALVGSDGGFLIQKDFSTAMLARAQGAATVWPRCFEIPVGEMADGVELPMINETSRATGSRWGGVQVYRKAEAEAVSASKPSFAKLNIDLEDLMGLMYVTDRLSRDASALGAIIDRAFRSEFAFIVDNEILRGTGVGQCLGILNSAALVTVAAEGGQSADTVVAGNVTKMYARMPSHLKGGAVWLVHSDVAPQLQTMTIGTQPIYVPPGQLSDEPFGRLLGRPILEIEQASALGDVGDILLVNLQEYVLASKGIEAAESIHVRFIYNEKALRWNLRINGAPSWSSSLTPFKGSNAKSPFIALAAR